MSTREIATKKIRRGEYLITRDDGKTFEVKRGWPYSKWWVNGIPIRGTLRAIKFDIKMGYHPYLG